MQDFKNSFFESISAVKPAHLFERKLRFLPDRIVYSGAEFKWENYKKRVLWAVGKPGFAYYGRYIIVINKKEDDLFKLAA